MIFRTQVDLPEKETEIGHSQRIMLFGSCFAENIGNLLAENKFHCDVNPFGILYNPRSIVYALKQILAGKEYQKEDLFVAGGQWHSWMHHSDFSDVESDVCIAKINSRLQKASDELFETDWLIVTWGTAYVYLHKENQMVVGNCHKQSDKLFVRKRLSVGEIVDDWETILNELRMVNPRLKVLFTVSPIRHQKDGMHANQLSKSTLLLAVDAICRKWQECYYFPSYEIMMDELRDYRFYADDMAHPSSMAIEYIWKCFASCYFGKETQAIMKEWADIKRGLAHQPFRPESDAYRAFLSQIVLKIKEMKEKLPYLDVQKEMELCESRLKI